MTEQFRDYGYRAWEDVRPGDWVEAEAYRQPRLVRVHSVESIPPEHTLTGSDDYLRVYVGGTPGVALTSRVVTQHHHTTVYYRAVS